MNSMNWMAASPQIALLIMACGVMLFDLWSKHPRRLWTYALALFSIAVFCGLHIGLYTLGARMNAMQGMLISDPLGHLVSFFAGLSVMMVLVYAQRYAADRGLLKGELFSITLFALLGMSVMVTSQNFLVMYLGLELMSLSLYSLVALRRDHGVSTEAAMKYFVLGALASGFLLYGLSMIYGATGSLNIDGVSDALQGSASIVANKQVLAVGLVFVVSGLAFKLGVVPFHMWVPDVYHGASTAATMLIAGAPKLAAFVLVVRLLMQSMDSMGGDWRLMLMILCMASLLLGNVVAIAQSNVKRMLAYSAIAQSGFMLLGMTPVGATPLASLNGVSSALFYVITYVFTTVGGFAVLAYLSTPDREADQWHDLAGLHQRSPLMAAAMALFMLSLAGIPPTVGFYAKLSVLQAMITTGESLYLVLAVAAVLLSLVGAYYYLRVIKTMYFDPPVRHEPLSPMRHEASVLLAVNGVVVLLLGVFPSGLMSLCAKAIGLSLV